MTPEVLNMGLIFHLPKESADISRIYKYLGYILVEFLKKFEINANLGFTDNSYCDGRYNVNIYDRKVIGTSQKWSSPKNDIYKILFHATINVSAPPDTLCRIANLYFKQADIANIVLPEKHTTLLEQAASQYREGAVSMDGIAQKLLDHIKERFLFWLNQHWDEHL